MPIDSSIPLSFKMPQIAGPMENATKALTLAGLLDQQRMRQMQMRDETALRGVLQQTGGDHDKAIKALVASGTPQGIKLAGVLAEAVKDLRNPAQRNQVVAPGSTVLGPNNEVVYSAPKPFEPKTRTFQHGEESVTEELQPDGKWKIIGRGPKFAKSVGPTIVNPPAVTGAVVKDPTSPTGWSHANLRTGQIVAKGAPPPASDPATAGARQDAKNASDQRRATAEDQRTALLALKAAGYNPETGADAIEGLIAKSTSGGAQRFGAEAAAFVNVTTEGRKALNTLQAAANKITLELMNRKLGAGISNADRDFILQQLGDVGNAMKTADERLAAWRFAKSRMIDVGLLPAAGENPLRRATDKPGANLPSASDIDAELRRRQGGG